MNFEMQQKYNMLKEKNRQRNGGIIRMCERVAASGGTLTPYSA